MFSRVVNPFLIFLLDYHVSVTSKIQVNSLYRRYLKVQMIVSYEFLKFLHYICFRYCLWYSCWATMFWWPRKSRSSSGTGSTWRYWWLCFMNFRNFSTIYILEGGKPFLIFLLSYHVLMTTKIQVNFQYRRYLKILLILFYIFLTFSHYPCFRGRGIYFRYCYLATNFGCPRKFRSTSGSGGTDDSV